MSRLSLSAASPEKLNSTAAVCCATQSVSCKQVSQPAVDRWVPSRLRLQTEMCFYPYCVLVPGSRPVCPVCPSSGWSQLCGTLPSKHAGRGRHGDLDVPRQSRPVPLLPPKLRPGVSHLRSQRGVQVAGVKHVRVCVADVPVLDSPDVLGKSAHRQPFLVCPSVSSTLDKPSPQQGSTVHHCCIAKQKWAFRGEA